MGLDLCLLQVGWLLVAAKKWGCLAQSTKESEIEDLSRSLSPWTLAQSSMYTTYM